MKELHQFTIAADEDEHVTVLYATAHTLVYHTAERADALAHIRPARAKEVTHRIIQAEHGSRDKRLSSGKPSLPCRFQDRHELHWGTAR